MKTRDRVVGKFLSLILFFLVVPFAAGAVKLPEYKVKAEMMIRLGEFVAWPAEAFPSPDAPFVIGIVGDDPFENHLASLIQSEKIHGHPILLRSIPLTASPEGCHMLFVSKTAQEKIHQILAQVGGTPLLTVGDHESMCRKGVHIGFLVADGRVRFSINLRSAQKSRLTITSQLLRLAVKVLEADE